MLVYAHLIPSLLSINPIDILTTFQKKYPEYRIIDCHSFDEGQCCEITFETSFIDDYRELWKKEKEFTKLTPAHEVLIQALQQMYKIKLYSSGLVTISCETLDLDKSLTSQQILNEMRWIFRSFHEKILIIAAELGFVNSDSLSRLQMPIAQGFANPNGLAERFREHLTDVVKSNKIVISNNVLAFQKEFGECSWPFFQEAGLDKWTLWYEETVMVKDYTKRLIATYHRVSTHINVTQKPSWDQLCLDGDVFFGLLGQIVNHARFIIEIFSNRVGIAGLYLSLITTCIGLIPVSFRALHEFSFYFALGFSLMLAGIALFTAIMWKKPTGKNLVNQETNLVLESLR